MTATATPLVRDARAPDLVACHSLYAHHVLHGAGSFEEQPPTPEEFATRRESVLCLGLPFLVAESRGAVVGYSYAALFRARSAYRYTLEDSVYVAHDQAGRGIGHALLEELIARCERGPWRQMVAVIGDSANLASVKLHARLGFRPAGTLTAVGFKFGRWLDAVFMQRGLGDGADTLPPTSPPGA